MAEHETIADIRKDAEAKFRELVEAYMQRRAAFQTTIGAMQAFNTVFDRLEAAIKRERAKIEADALEVGGIVEAAHKQELSKNASKNASNFGQLGDAAKLREALEKCREIALQWQADEAAGVAGTTDKPHSRSAAEAVVDMEFEINAALAATEKEGGAK